MPFSGSTIRLTVRVGSPGGDGHLRVCLSGELDNDEAGRLRDAVSGAVARFSPRHVVLDATELVFLDSAGIRGLLECRELAEKAGAGLSVVHASPIVYQVLQVTELVEYLAVTPAAAGGVGHPSRS